MRSESPRKTVDAIAEIRACQARSRWRLRSTYYDCTGVAKICGAAIQYTFAVLVDNGVEITRSVGGWLYDCDAARGRSPDRVKSDVLHLARNDARAHRGFDLRFEQKNITSTHARDRAEYRLGDAIDRCRAPLRDDTRCRFRSDAYAAEAIISRPNESEYGRAVVFEVLVES